MHYLIWPNFLSESECDQFIAHGNSITLERSRGFQSDTAQLAVSDYRTSYQTWVARNLPLAFHVERRICLATNTRPECCEAFQLCRYGPGEYYKKHHDYFHVEYEPSARACERAGQRIITFMVYLNTLPENAGGETEFVYANLKVRPEKGKALVFWNLQTNGEPDESTYHEGLPVAEGYEKWIINKWIHPRRFV